MGIAKEYRLFVKNNDKLCIDKSARVSLQKVIKIYLDKLKALQALSSYDKGVFVTTINPFTKETLVKRYVLHINFPNTSFIIMKEEKGSLDEFEFLNTLKFIKEKYYERI